MVHPIIELQTLILTRRLLVQELRRCGTSDPIQDFISIHGVDARGDGGAPNVVTEPPSDSQGKQAGHLGIMVVACGKPKWPRTFSTNSLASFNPKSMNMLTSFMILIFTAASYFSSYKSNALFSMALASMPDLAPNPKVADGPSSETAGLYLLSL
nr:hypothetical protein CFP56_59242 [Quercus suber]